jgi:mono/diheme cytochrome c family protein
MSTPRSLPGLGSNVLWRVAGLLFLLLRLADTLLSRRELICVNEIGRRRGYPRATDPVMKLLLAASAAASVAIAAAIIAQPGGSGDRPAPPGESPEVAGPSGASPPAEIAPASGTTAPDLTSSGAATSVQLARGARSYRSLCLACHLPDGKGMIGAIPPLAGSDYMLEDRERAVRIVLKGLEGAITVNGHAYAGVMPALEGVLTDAQVADVLTYVFNSWGNKGDGFDASHVGRLRAAWRDLPGVVPAPLTGQ